MYLIALPNHYNIFLYQICSSVEVGTNPTYLLKRIFDQGPLAATTDISSPRLRVVIIVWESPGLTLIAVGTFIRAFFCAPHILAVTRKRSTPTA